MWVYYLPTGAWSQRKKTRVDDYDAKVKRAMWALSNNFTFEVVAQVYGIAIAQSAWARLKAKGK
jgi:hypothetical protein